MTSFDQKDIEKLENASSQAQFEDIIREKEIVSNSATALFKQIYQFSTIRQYSCQQKERLLNVTLHFIDQISHGCPEKAVFRQKMDKQIRQLPFRNKDFKQLFSEAESLEISHFFKQAILPYYDLYEIVLDRHPHFSIQAKSYEPVPTVHENSMDKGSIIEVDTIPILKKFIGIRQPKQEKKDVKKK